MHNIFFNDNKFLLIGGIGAEIMALMFECKILI